MATELATREPQSIVRASGDIVEALAEYKRIQTALDRSMPDCIMQIQGRNFRKKPYWRAIATAFNLDVILLSEELQRFPGDDLLAPGDWGYVVTYKATAPNGRSCTGDGSCFATEKRAQNQKTVHNVRSHAHTRAFNRAVSNLVGFGEVSAEEAIEEPGSYDGPPVEDPAPAPTPKQKSGLITEPQRRRLYAISKRMQEGAGMTDEALKAVVTAVLSKHGFSSSTEITTDEYEAICDDVAQYSK